MNFIKIFSFLFLTFLITNCASIIEGTDQAVSINSNVQGAKVYINGSMVGKTPYNGQIKKKSDTQVRIEKEGYTSQTLTMNTSLPTAFWGNIIFGGFTGSTTDFVSGAAYEYSPNNYFLHIEKEKASNEERAQADQMNKTTKFVLINRNQLINDIYRGDGEYLDALIKLKDKNKDRNKYISQLQSWVALEMSVAEFALKVSRS